MQTCGKRCSVARADDGPPVGAALLLATLAARALISRGQLVHKPKSSASPMLLPPLLPVLLDRVPHDVSCRKRTLEARRLQPLHLAGWLGMEMTR